MTFCELTALGNQIKALAAERDRLIVRREGLVTERRELWERQLAVRDSARRLALIAPAIRRDEDILRGDRGPQLEAVPRWLGAGGSPDQPGYLSAQSEASAARNRARSAA